MSKSTIYFAFIWLLVVTLIGMYMYDIQSKKNSEVKKKIIKARSKARKAKSLNKQGEWKKAYGLLSVATRISNKYKEWGDTRKSIQGVSLSSTLYRVKDDIKDYYIRKADSLRKELELSKSKKYIRRVDSLYEGGIPKDEETVKNIEKSKEYGNALYQVDLEKKISVASAVKYCGEKSILAQEDWNKLIIREIPTGEVISTIDVSQEDVNFGEFSFANNCNRIYAVTKKHLHTLDGNKFSRHKTYRLPIEGGISTSEIKTFGDKIFLSATNAVLLLEIDSSGLNVLDIFRHKNSTSMDITKSGKMLVSGSCTGTDVMAKVWNTATGERKFQMTLDRYRTESAELSKNCYEYPVSFVLNDEYLLVGSAKIRLIHTSDFDTRKVYDGFSKDTPTLFDQQIKTTPKGKYILLDSKILTADGLNLVSKLPSWNYGVGENGEIAVVGLSPDLHVFYDEGAAADDIEQPNTLDIPDRVRSQIVSLSQPSGSRQEARETSCSISAGTFLYLTISSYLDNYEEKSDYEPPQNDVFSSMKEAAGTTFRSAINRCKNHLRYVVQNPQDSFEDIGIEPHNLPVDINRFVGWLKERSNSIE